MFLYLDLIHALLPLLFRQIRGAEHSDGVGQDLRVGRRDPAQDRTAGQHRLIGSFVTGGR